MVRQIERLDPELRGEPFTDLEVLKHGQIQILKGRPMNNPQPGVAERTSRRPGERGRVEPWFADALTPHGREVSDNIPSLRSEADADTRRIHCRGHRERRAGPREVHAGKMPPAERVLSQLAALPAKRKVIDEIRIHNVSAIQLVQTLYEMRWIVRQHWADLIHQIGKTLGKSVRYPKAQAGVKSLVQGDLQRVVFDSAVPRGPIDVAQAPVWLQRRLALRGESLHSARRERVDAIGTLLIDCQFSYIRNIQHHLAGQLALD